MLIYHFVNTVICSFLTSMCVAFYIKLHDSCMCTHVHLYVHLYVQMNAWTIHAQLHMHIIIVTHYLYIYVCTYLYLGSVFPFLHKSRKTETLNSNKQLLK